MDSSHGDHIHLHSLPPCLTGVCDGGCRDRYRKKQANELTQASARLPPKHGCTGSAECAKSRRPAVVSSGTAVLAADACAKHCSSFIPARNSRHETLSRAVLQTPFSFSFLQQYRLRGQQRYGDDTLSVTGAKPATRRLFRGLRRFFCLRFVSMPQCVRQPMRCALPLSGRGRRTG